MRYLFDSIVNEATNMFADFIGANFIEASVKIFGIAVIVFCGLIAISCICYPLHKPIETVLNAFGIYWSICLLNVPAKEYTTAQITAIFIITGMMVVFGIVHHWCPFFYSEETVTTSYYLVLGTLFEGESVEGGLFPVCALGFGITAIGSFIAYFIVRTMEFQILGLVGIIVSAVMLIANVITFIIWIKNEVCF